MGLICAALGVSIDEYFGIVKRPTTEEQLAEAHRAMADADAKHSAALRIAHLEGGMEQLTGSVAKHEKRSAYCKFGCISWRFRCQLPYP